MERVNEDIVKSMLGSMFGMNEPVPRGPPPTQEELAAYPEITASDLQVNQAGGGRHTGDLVGELLTIRNQIKLYHWQTKSFARHKSSDDLTTSLDASIDAFVETYMGKYGRPRISGNIVLHNFSDKAVREFVDKQTHFLTEDIPNYIRKTDTDLLNIRDTILGDLNKALYLFTLS